MSLPKKVAFYLLTGLAFLFAFAKLPSILNFVSPGAVPRAGEVDFGLFARQLFLAILYAGAGIGLATRSAPLARGLGTILCPLLLGDSLLALLYWGHFSPLRDAYPIAYLISVHYFFRAELGPSRPAV